ncbi:reverse transcriptase domain-containing protein [Tanacetum coccineum]|uniref:Reverse transcriptase domain-containing protein n=1 Tax=Tanacetum coccineum TaxID=301880 RepID=A0ABQ5HT04_9ASTR
MYLRLCIEDGYGWDGNAGIIKAGTVFREPPYPFNYPTRRLEEACTETTNERCLTVLLNELPSKEKDLRNFTIPCQVLEKHKEAEDLAADHLSRFKSLHMEVLTEREIADKFSDKHLMVLKSKFKDDEPWYVDFVNYIVGKVVPPNWTFEKRKRCFSQVKTYFWEEPFAFKLCADNIMRRCVARSETLKILAHCHSGTYRVGIVVLIFRNRGLLVPGFYLLSVFKDANEYGLDFMGPFPESRGNKYILVDVDYVSKWVEAQALPTNDARIVVKFLRNLFARFGVPKALISDRGTHFCNSQLEKALQRYGVTHKLSMAYHPQSNGQTEVTNRAIKRILERSVGYNPKGWSEKLNDALWAFRTAYKTPTGCTPFRLVYGKACHLPIEIEHKAHWALKQCNMDLTLASKSRLMQLNELAELRDGAYENTRIYKERTKKWHDSRLRGDKYFKSVFLDCLYSVSKPHGYGDRLSGRYPVFIFSTVDTAYSLNEYSVFNTGINTAYPGNNEAFEISPDSDIDMPYLKTLKNSRPLPDFEEYAVYYTLVKYQEKHTFSQYSVPKKLDTPYPRCTKHRTRVAQYAVPNKSDTPYRGGPIRRIQEVRYAVSRRSDTPYPYQLKKILEYFILGAHAKQPRYAVLSSNTPYRPIFRVYKYQNLNTILDMLFTTKSDFQKINEAKKVLKSGLINGKTLVISTLHYTRSVSIMFNRSSMISCIVTMTIG